MFWNFWKKWFCYSEPDKEYISIKTNLEMAIDKYSNIQSENFEHIYLSNNSLITIMTCSPNIITYINLINKLIKSLTEDKLLFIPDIPQKVETVYLRDWFIVNNYFIDVASQMYIFNTSASVLLNLYKNTEKIKDKSFNTEKNLLVMQNVISNLIFLSSELSSVRLQF